MREACHPLNRHECWLPGPGGFPDFNQTTRSPKKWRIQWLACAHGLRPLRHRWRNYQVAR